MDYLDKKVFDEIDKFWEGETDGFTVNRLGESPTGGFMVGTGIMFKFQPRSSLNYNQQLTAWACNNANFLDHRNLYYIGGWYDKETDMYYIEISVNVPTFMTADILADSYNQKAIYKVETGEVITV